MAATSDIARISQLFNEFAAAVPAFKSMTAKVRCDSLRPHDFNPDVFRRMDSFRLLADFCAQKDVNVAINFAVCHFKPGPDANGLYKINNPEAVVIVRLDPDGHFADSRLRIYPDKHTGAAGYDLSLAEVGQRVAVCKPFKLKKN